MTKNKINFILGFLVYFVLINVLSTIIKYVFFHDLFFSYSILTLFTVLRLMIALFLTTLSQIDFIDLFNLDLEKHTFKKEEEPTKKTTRPYPRDTDIDETNKLYVIDNISNREFLLENNVTKAKYDFPDNAYIEYNIVEKTWHGTPTFMWLYVNPPKNLVNVQTIVKWFNSEYSEAHKSKEL